MWLRLARYGAAAQLVTLMLSGCAQEPQVVAVKTQIARPPVACRTAPKALPKLPDRAIATGELAANYNRLQAQYRRESGRFRLCQKYVARLR
jgi:hypothetical protein